MADRAPNDPLQELGNRLRRLRAALGLRQVDVAARARISQPRISQIERGNLDGPVPERTLVDLADALGISLIDLVGDDPVYDWIEHGVAAPGGRLPPELSPTSDLVGREVAIARIMTLLVGDEIRLLTLSGPGGVGKTQLALRAALEAGSAFEETTVISLAHCTDLGQAVTAMAYARGIREREARPLRDRLLADLRSAHRLVLLDNVEQLLPAMASLAAELLAACPWLTLLVTSRVPLQIRGEHVYPVQPLPLPDTATDLDVDRVAASSAVQLFLHRARAVAPDLALTPKNAPIVAEIVRRLDGLPLAIELAAVRSRAFPPAAMLRRLEGRLAFLSKGPRDLPDRHQSLRAAMDWSQELLSDDERTLFRRLAVFADGFVPETVGAIVQRDDGSQGTDALLDHAAALLDWGLLSGGEQPDGTVRYTMLETVREYARERLDSAGETADVHRKHLDWCLSLAEDALPHMFTADEADWLGRLQQDDANLQAALDWAFGRGRQTDLEAGLRLTGALTDYWYTSGRMTEGRDWLTRAIEASARRPPSLGRARSLVGACLLEQTQAAVVPATAHGEEGLAMARSLGDQPTIGRALLLVGNLAMMRGELARARALHQEALALFVHLGDRAWCALAHLNLGMDFHREGQLAEAVHHAEEALAISRAIGDRWDTIATLRLLGEIARDQGNLQTATAVFTESLHLSWQTGSEREAADCLSGLGAVAAAAGDLEKAARLLGAAESLYRRIDVAMPPPLRPDWSEIVSRVRDGLGPSWFTTSWAANSPEQAILDIVGTRTLRERHAVGHSRRRSAPQRGERTPGASKVRQRNSQE